MVAMAMEILHNVAIKQNLPFNDDDVRHIMEIEHLFPQNQAVGALASGAAIHTAVIHRNC